MNAATMAPNAVWCAIRAYVVPLWPNSVRWPGIAVAIVLALAASWMAGGLGEPLARNPVLVAMMLGLLLGNTLRCPEVLRPGLDYTKRILLRLAVVLVGFRITAALLVDLGPLPLLIAAAELALVLLVLGALARRVFGLDGPLALLVAAGSAICGAAAILAVAAVVRAKEQHAGIAIALITLSGTVALLAYPVAFMAGVLPGLDERWYGVFVGASIYELAQVYGASFAVSEGALNAATLVKLSKVLMLLPLVLALGLWQRYRDAAAKLPPTPWPWFIGGFVIVVSINSSITLHPQLRQLILELDQFLFMMVMVALGLTTSLTALAHGGLGWRLLGSGLAGLLLSTAIAWGLVAALSPSADGTSAPPAGEQARMLAHPGGRLFAEVGCSKCHVPALHGRWGEVPLYSDLLLHDMGPALDDKIAQGEAGGADWRTTPLVGLAHRRRYLHDGRATTLRDAVIAHGGEAQRVQERFFALADDKQQAVYRFLEGL